ncbi:hypothetical protein ACVIJW_004053 [Bradyrhizobium barranii subsp. barranii]
MIEHPAMPDMLLPGDIILTRGHGFIDFFIRLAQALARGRLHPSPYSHAAICVNRRLTGTPYRPPKGTPLIGVLCW